MRVQRPAEKLRSVAVTALQFSEEDGALLLGASAAHDLAAVHGLVLLLGWPGILVVEQLLRLERFFSVLVRVECRHQRRPFLYQTHPGVRMQMAVVMVVFSVGLFAGADVDLEVRDNLDLVRWLRLPKGHE